MLGLNYISLDNTVPSLDMWRHVRPIFSPGFSLHQADLNLSAVICRDPDLDKSQV